MKIFFSSHTGKTLNKWNELNYAIGNLFSPSSRKTAPKYTYALDNGAFIAFANKIEFDHEKYVSFINNWFSLNCPSRCSWMIVPDVVGNKEETLSNWHRYEEPLRRFNVPLAIAVQDGMTKEDIPPSVDVIFVGGTTNWKLETIEYWCANFPRVHVGRVNDWARLWLCYQHKVESVDGSGYFRKGDNGPPAINAHLFLRWQAGYIQKDWREIWSLSPSARHHLLNQSLGINFSLDDLPLFANLSA